MKEINEEIMKSNKDRRLTLDEMYDIFMGDAYKAFRERAQLEVKTANNGKRYVEYIVGWFNNDTSPLLYQHIAAEQLLQAADYQKVNWRMAMLGNSFAIVKLLDLCMNPLVWVNAEKFNDIVIEGRVAEEDYDATRYIDKYELFGYLNNQAVLRFADELPCCDEDSLELGYTKGMHYWLEITLDDSKHYHNVLNGASADFNEWQKAKGYNLGKLRDNLTYIAKERGGGRAAMILQMLQQEWPKIKLWKTHFENMTDDDICHFEMGLFHGFDDLLAEWEQETEQSNTRGPKETTVFKDSETAKREKERFMSFINRHKMSEDDVDAAWDNRVNQVTVCFYRIWKEKNMLTAKAGGTSLSRFIIDCGLSISVKEKAHGNALNRMINSDDLFTNWIGEVRASFQK